MFLNNKPSSSEQINIYHHLSSSLPRGGRGRGGTT
jgi:hypothetical protein